MRIYVSVYVCMSMCTWGQEPEKAKGVWSPGAGVIGNCKGWCRCGELHSKSMQEQMPSTPEPSLQPPKLHTLNVSYINSIFIFYN